MPESAQDILREMAEKYGACGSYRDRGEVVRVHIDGTPRARRRTDIQPFKTLFVRPDRFRFETRNMTVGPESEWDRHIIVGIGDAVRTFVSTVEDEGPPQTLASAISGASGVSGGSAITIPRLLMPGLFGGPRPHERWKAEIDGEEEIDGEVCWKLLAGLPSRRSSEFWIGRETRLLRRVFARSVFDDAQRDEMMRFLREREKEYAEKDPAAAALMRKSMESTSRRPDGQSSTTEATTSYVPLVDVEIDAREFDAPM